MEDWPASRRPSLGTKKGHHYDGPFVVLVPLFEGISYLALFIPPSSLHGREKVCTLPCRRAAGEGISLTGAGFPGERQGGGVEGRPMRIT
jgi:hypothetical protein